ncbi:MAG: hypothetical protein IT349_00990 [Candidatus Eisenbacteria bacterium]|nr:hypothetical protein [Candidatus Eisenbacteria bacterium]
MRFRALTRRLVQSGFTAGTVTGSGATLSARLLLAGILFTAAALPPAQAAGRYDPILEWDGAVFRVLHDPDRPQWIEDPPIELPFIQPRGIVAREHDGRDVVYVLDAGRHRILAFEANATYSYLSSLDLTYDAAPGAGEFSGTAILPPEYLATPTQWIVPFSEAVHLDGEEWTRVDDLTGFVAADKVYTVDYAATTNQPKIDFPSGSLESDTIFEVRYLLSDLQDEGAGTPVFGLGEIDRGVHSGSLAFTRVTIDESSGGPTRWDEPRGLALSTGIADATTDVLYVIDAADQSGAGNEQIFSYLVTTSGSVSAGEAYDDRLTHPYDASVAVQDAGAGASAWISADTGPFDKASYPFVVDASQVTGHAYTVVVNAGAVTISDATTGRVLVSAGAEANIADPCLVVPGLSLPLNSGPWADGSTTIHTKRAHTGRYLFVADTGGNRIKVVSLPSATTAAGSVWDGDWLPSDDRTGLAEPSAAGTIGANAGDEYNPTTPVAVGENHSGWTAAFPVREETLEEIVFDPSGDALAWQRVDNLEVMSPTDSVFTVDWRTGRILFGDGIHGAIPPANTEYQFSYGTSADVMRYGSAGTALGRFSSPRGIAARWNSSLARFDLYVADAGNQRVQKLAYFPPDTTLQLPPRITPINSWRFVSTSEDLMGGPSDVAVASDGDGIVYVAVTDPSKDRVAIYRDVDAAVPGSTTPPSFYKVLGTRGNRLGNYVEPLGVAFVGNGTDLDLYLTDDARGVAVKYEGGPSPEINILTVGESDLPQSFPPHSGYLITFNTRYPPLGGWVDFYFDTSSVFNESTAKLCFEEGTISPTATSAFWSFADSPGGLPPDGAYYLFARLKDSTGSTVAWDQTDLLDLITIDSNLLPTLQLRDAIDGDETLYLQPNLERDVNLEILYPDSLVAAGFVGTYDPTLIKIEGVTQGTAWDGTGATNVIFTATVDSVAGRFEISSSAVGAPTGLTRSGPHIVAILQVRCQADAIDLTTRWKDGVMALDPARTRMTRIDGTEPELYRARSLKLRCAYLGDLATTAAGADSLVPHLMPRPDGRIDFEDQMIFTIGWNGADFEQDRIADLGPAAGDSPTMLPEPDALWDVEDILVFTSQANYFSAAGWNNASPAPAARAAGANQGALTAISDDTPPPFAWRWEEGAEGERTLVVEARELQRVCGAQFTISPWPANGTVRNVAAGELMARGAQVLTLHATRAGALEIGLSRLAARSAEVSGSGEVLRLSLDAAAASALAQTGGVLTYELRDAANRRIGTGQMALDPSARIPAAPVLLQFTPVQPNPIRGAALLRFGLPQRETVRLRLYDVQGREIRTLFEGVRDAGWHEEIWDTATDDGRPAPSGVYYARLEVGGRALHRTLTLRR